MTPSPPNSQNNLPQSDSALCMRFELHRLGSFSPIAGVADLNNQPGPLAADGYFYDAELKTVYCFFCSSQPRSHTLSCTRQTWNVKNGVTNCPPIDRNGMMDIMRVKPRA
ncbi:hypothetical protein V1264_015541 [Littorina saxatilis]|uniref:Uncharacterized protein n=1 Tax=Littorina saxatilis TaxID=31220 RepID=A0AAN9BLE9_9CAEN